jgi:hypothetical protein
MAAANGFPRRSGVGSLAEREEMRLFASGVPLIPEPCEQLAEALAHGPFSRALSLAIDVSGLGLARLRQRLMTAGIPISTTTLSYWRTGRSRPERPESLRAVERLEAVLEVPSGALTGLLDRRGAPPRAGRTAAKAARWDRLWETRSTLLTVVNSFEVAQDASLEVISLHESLHIGADRVMRTHRVREVVRAAADGVLSKLVVLRGLPAGSAPLLGATRYCRPGRQEVVAEEAFMVSELILDQPLDSGETTILEYGFAFVDAAVDTRYDRRFRHPVHEYLVELRFDPAAPPASCHSYRQDSSGGPEQQVSEVRLRTAAPAHVVHSGVSPGIRGVRWRWT